MKILKYSEVQADSVSAYLKRINDILSIALTNISEFKKDSSSYSSQWEENYWTNFYIRPSTAEMTPEAAAEAVSEAKSSARRKVRTQATTYSDSAKFMESYLPDVKKNMETVATAFEEIKKIIDHFDDNDVSLKAKLESLEGISGTITVNTIGEGENAVESIVYTYVDPVTGEEIAMTIAELVNSFYTYAGSTVPSVIAAQMIGNEMSYSEEQIQTMMKDAVANSGTYVNNLSYDGYMSVAAMSDITGVYKAVFPETTFEASDQKGGVFENQYNSVITSLNATHEGLDSEKLFGENATAMATALGCTLAPGLISASAFNLTDNLNEYNNREREKDKKTNAQPLVASLDEEKILADGEGSDPSFIPEQNQVPITNPTPVVQPSGSGQPTGGEPLVEPIMPEEVVTPVDPVDPVEPVEPVEPVGGEDGPGSGQETYVPEFVEPVRTEIPKEMPEVADITPEEVDAQAQEAYYEKYGDDLGEHRAELSTEFEELFMKDDKTELVEKFEDMGYTSEEAEIAANNREVGLSAYMLGSQKSETAQIANQIAKDNNLSGFDTTHDDTPQFEDLTNGKAFAELNDPIGNQDIAVAKENYVEAKEAYVEAVDTANDSIADAQAAKTQLQETIRSVSRVSGSDQGNWSQEQVDKINEATRKYNDAVIKANQDVANSEKVKATYDLAKDTYLDKKEDYYQSLVNEYLENQAANNTSPSPSPSPGTGNGQQNNDVSADDFLNLIDSNNGNISV